MSTIIMFIIFAIILGIFLFWVDPLGMRPNPGNKENKRKEKKLLQILIKDMKKNPGHWLKNGFSPQMLSSPTLINDKKNMGILYKDKEDKVIIHFNMKDVTKFNHNDTDTIITTITGKHVIKFLKTATYLLNHRGKELEYFTERLEERL